MFLLVNRLVMEACHNRLVVHRMKHRSIEEVPKLMRRLAEEICQLMNWLQEEAYELVHRLSEQSFWFEYDVVFHLVHGLFEQLIHLKQQLTLMARVSLFLLAELSVLLNRLT